MEHAHIRERAGLWLLSFTSMPATVFRQHAEEPCFTGMRSPASQSRWPFSDQKMFVFKGWPHKDTMLRFLLLSANNSCEDLGEEEPAESFDVKWSV